MKHKWNHRDMDMFIYILKCRNSILDLKTRHDSPSIQQHLVKGLFQ
ncbi:hypothetical protein GDO86_016365 [Hymenochirus boettgeri]|nr:hypothetical protein GDO86_016365 [Hymenochirus boettgeri]